MYTIFFLKVHIPFRRGFYNCLLDRDRFKGRKPDWVLRSLAAVRRRTLTDLLRLQKNYFLLKNTLNFARKSLKNALNGLIFLYFLCKFTFSATSLGEVIIAFIQSFILINFII